MHIRILFNFLLSIFYSVQIYLQWKKYNEFDIKTVGSLNNSIKKSGCFTMKLTQWIITRMDLLDNNELVKYFKDFMDYYEKCPEHSYAETVEIIENDFGKIENIFESIDENPIASGTIGQVYWAKLLDGQEVAVKVCHPNIGKETIVPFAIIKYFNLFLRKAPYFYKYSLPIDFSGFFDIFNMQVDMKNEGKNLDMFNENFKGNKLVTFPKHIFSSKNVLVMTFEDGTYFEKLNISEYKKYKIAITFALASRQMMLVDNFLHCDPHMGNWKVRKIDKEYQIIYYDVGLSITTKNKTVMKDIVESKEQDDPQKMTDVLINSIYYLPKDVDKTDMRNEIYEMTKTITSKKLNFFTTITDLLGIFSKRGVIFNNEILNILVTGTLAENIFSKYGLINKNDEGLSKDDFYKTELMNYISFCETHDIFPEVANYYREIIDHVEFEDIFHSI